MVVEEESVLHCTEPRSYFVNPVALSLHVLETVQTVPAVVS